MIGYECDKLDTNRLYVRPGKMYNSNYSKEVHLSTTLLVDMATVGVNGLDTGSPTNGHDYFVYIIENAQGTVAAVISHSITYGGVVLPAGYTHVRKLRFGFVYNTTRGGIPNFHASHWPMPFVRFTDAQYSAAWMPLAAGKASTWTKLDLSNYLPDNARLVALAVSVRYNNGSAGSGYLRSYSGQPTGILAGSASPGSPFPGQMTLDLRTDSTRKIEYKTTGDVDMYIQILGYSMTEPS